MGMQRRPLNDRATHDADLLAALLVLELGDLLLVQERDQLAQLVQIDSGHRLRTIDPFAAV
jgi:hypothetical protein